MFWKVFLIVVIACMLVFNCPVIATPPNDGELQEIRQYDPYEAPHENIDLMKEAMLFELYARIEQCVIMKFGHTGARFYEIAGVRKDGHGGFNIKVTGYVERGEVVDNVEIILGSPHFGSALVVEDIFITGSKKKQINMN